MSTFVLLVLFISFIYFSRSFAAIFSFFNFSLLEHFDSFPQSHVVSVLPKLSFHIFSREAFLT
jgi:hypothetical protein